MTSSEQNSNGGLYILRTLLAELVTRLDNVKTSCSTKSKMVKQGNELTQLLWWNEEQIFFLTIGTILTIGQLEQSAHLDLFVNFVPTYPETVVRL